MGIADLATLAREVGLPILLSVGLFYFCFWVVKFIVTNMCKSLTDLVNDMKTFTARVHGEHQSISGFLAMHHANADERHKKTMDEHDRMIKNLNDITLSLGRINGYKDHG